MIRFKQSPFWILILLIVLDILTPGFPLIGIVLLFGMFRTRFLRNVAEKLTRYCDVVQNARSSKEVENP